MLEILDVILPVFLVIGFGYVVTWRKWISDAAIDGVMKYAQNFAVPCLLFFAISKIDLSSDFNLPLMLSFYSGAFGGYLLGFLGAKYLFKRPLEDCIAIGFCGLFSNALLLGLAITERAYGADALTANYAIVSIHAPILYTFGIVMMEMAKTKGGPKGLPLVFNTFKSVMSNPLVIGIGLGFVVNILKITLPSSIDSALAMMVRSALPAALFGLGGVLFRYRPEGDVKAIGMVTVISLIAHPAITYGMGKWVFHLDQAQFRSAVLTAAMAPGINTYMFANMYGAARRVAASGVLIATAVSILTVSMWLWILP